MENEISNLFCGWLATSACRRAVAAEGRLTGLQILSPPFLFLLEALLGTVQLEATATVGPRGKLLWPISEGDGILLAALKRPLPAAARRERPLHVLHRRRDRDRDRLRNSVFSVPPPSSTSRTISVCASLRALRAAGGWDSRDSSAVEEKDGCLETSLGRPSPLRRVTAPVPLPLRSRSMPLLKDALQLSFAVQISKMRTNEVQAIPIPSIQPRTVCTSSKGRGKALSLSTPLPAPLLRHKLSPCLHLHLHLHFIPPHPSFALPFVSPNRGQDVPRSRGVAKHGLVHQFALSSLFSWPLQPSGNT